MPSARHAEQMRVLRRRVPWVLLAGVLLAAAGTAVWAATRDSAGAVPATSAVRTGAGPSSPAATPAPSPAAPAAMAACRRSVAAAEAALAAARPGTAHWDTHVQAWHEVVAGRVPYSVAEVRWRQTRLAGPGDLARFGAADAAYRSRRDNCSAAVGAAGSGAPARACADRQVALDAAVAGDRAVLGDWAAHQRAMAAVRRHALSVGDARVLFRKAVKKAPVNQNRLGSALKRVAAAPNCPPGS